MKKPKIQNTFLKRRKPGKKLKWQEKVKETLTSEMERYE